LLLLLLLLRENASCKTHGCQRGAPENWGWAAPACAAKPRRASCWDASLAATCLLPPLLPLLLHVMLNSRARNLPSVLPKRPSPPPARDSGSRSVRNAQRALACTRANAMQHTCACMC
jgi:hypothetical protein